MCGIHAVINKASFAKSVLEGFMKDGFVAGSLRGMDSSGIFQIDKAGKPFMFKSITPGPQFIDSKQASAFLRDAATCPLTVAHVRAATQGKITQDNAHPFCVNRKDGTRIIGVHNGTLQGWNYKKDGSKFDVDSEWALSRIAEEGVDAFESFLGAWALVWWDEKEKDKVFIARNTERPLHFIRTKDKSGLLIASEAGMLTWLAERNRVDTEDTVYVFEPGKLYTIDTSGSEIKWTKVNYPSYKSSYYTPPGYSGNGNTGHWNAQRARWEDRRAADSVDVCGLGNDGESYVMGGTVMGTPPNKNRKDPECGDEALRVIGSVKKALADNRDKRFQRGKYAPDKQATASQSAGSSAAVAEESPEEFDDGYPRCKPDWYSVANATTTERNEAAEAGVMGELQYFQGIHYEPETGELYGEIEDFIPGTGKMKYDAIIRGVSGAEARKWTLTTGKGCWVSIIGKGVDKKINAMYFVTCPLNEKGIAELSKRAA